MKLGTALSAFLCLVIFSLSTTAQNTNRKLSGLARIDLFGASTVGSLKNGRIIAGDGSIDRQGWRSALEQPRSYSAHFGISRFEWTQIGFQFLPERSGTVALSLMGPWEEWRPGTLFLQEVLWDSLSSEGAVISNSSFETLSSGMISGWTGGESLTSTAAVPAVHGTRLARSWHDGAMTRNITVTGGVPVKFTVWARAYVPPNFLDMKPMSNRDTPAHRAALQFMRGVNFGNFLEYTPGTFSIDYTAQDYSQVRAEGFDHIRLPVAWHLYAGPAPEFRIGGNIFARVDTAIELAGRNQLALILDWHHFDAFMNAPTDHEAQFYSVWRQVAERYATAPATVAFELLNEPVNAATTPVVNRVYPEAIRQIRLTNPNRTIFVGPGKANSCDELQSLLLPDTDPNLIVSLHIYDPFLFTHQGASWAGPDVSTLGVVFPGPPSTPVQRNSRAKSSWVSAWFEAYNNEPIEFNPGGPAAFRGKIQRIRRWSDHFRRPIHVGEFGSYETADSTSRVNFHREIRHAMDEQGVGWAMWDWKAGFHYFQSGRPSPPGLRDALFPSVTLRLVGSDIIEFDAAVGKKFVLEKTSSLETRNWQTIETQTLLTPKATFTDPLWGAGRGNFYRVRWEK